ncbi:MAG: transposase [Bacteriovorax sp.]|nr:transposase [Bacteriovorax sp.]
MKIHKGKQLTFLNPSRAGRPAIHDKGIRHTSRPKVLKPTPLHLTIKVRENKADIQNKIVLKSLHRAIIRGRLKGLKIIHYTLEYNHVHLFVEAKNNLVLHKGMQALGITLSKAINKFKKAKGAVYKHRYHFRQITSLGDLKNVLNYIFNNGVKHKSTKTLVSFYNSLIVEKNLDRLYPEKINVIWAKIRESPHVRGLFKTLLCVLDENHYYLLAPDRARPRKT